MSSRLEKLIDMGYRLLNNVEEWREFKLSNEELQFECDTCFKDKLVELLINSIASWQAPVAVVIDCYPQTFMFFLKKRPAYLEKRTKILRKQLEKQQIPSPHHHYDDYAVENVETISDPETGHYLEIWHIGS
jgi:hypothetical protein